LILKTPLAIFNMRIEIKVLFSDILDEYFRKLGFFTEVLISRFFPEFFFL